MKKLKKQLKLLNEIKKIQNEIITSYLTQELWKSERESINSIKRNDEEIKLTQ